ncbi:MAG: efflux RND transporter periplasmic adaptor subunit [Burkholderiales bacterium]|nr:efflux RND transporter periplasmic adaptor subunit [Burkholderiales bacterium]
MSDIDPKLLSQLRIEGEQREDEGGRSRRTLWLALAGVLVVAALGGTAWWLLAARPLAVQTATAILPGGGGGGTAVLQATGYITARRQATVSTQITGTLTQVLIEEGVRVEKGQVIARLEDSGLRATLDVANANVKTAEAQVATAEAQLGQAQADSRRQQALVASGMATQQFAEQSRTAVSTATAQLDARRREADSARAQVAQARVNFDYSVVRAPFAGVVTVKAAQVGEIVSPLSAGGGFTRTGVGTIVDMDSLEIDVDVNEAYINQVKPDMPAEAVLSAYPDWKIPAHVIAIVPAADRGKATVKVRVALEQKDGRIVPDMGVRVSFLGPKAPAAAQPPRGVLVPPAAIAQRDGKSVVFVVDGGRVAQRSVAPAAQDFGAMKLLPDGVKAGERVVLSPPPALQDGANVTIEEPH